MLSNRKESFRFRFRDAISATLRLIKMSDTINTSPKKSSSGNVEILDISPGGLKVQTVFDIPVDEAILMELTFVIYEHPLNVIGNIIWRNKVNGYFHYGIRLGVTSDLKQQIIDELKKHSKKTHQKASATI